MRTDQTSLAERQTTHPMNEAIGPLEVEYDFVAIIDGLPDAERNEHKISAKLKELIEAHGFACERADCNTKRAVVAALQHSGIALSRGPSSACTSFVMEVKTGCGSRARMSQLNGAC